MHLEKSRKLTVSTESPKSALFKLTKTHSEQGPGRDRPIKMRFTILQLYYVITAVAQLSTMGPSYVYERTARNKRLSSVLCSMKVETCT